MNTVLNASRARSPCNDLDCARKTILALLDACHGMDIAEISRRTRLKEDLVHAALEGLVLRGELDCIEREGQNGQDVRFYALNRPEGHPWDY
jgi:hypothetical protein